MCASKTPMENQTVASEDPSENPDKDYVMLLIGKTGHGKSSTGNTILGRQQFEVSDSAKSVTDNVSVGWVRRGNSVIKVIDGPGIEDTRKTPAEDVKDFINLLGPCFVDCTEGFHALVLVLRYGTRFTREEQETIQKLKRIFGKNFVKDHCVVIFTHGENFDMNNDDEKTFDKWCDEQEGELRQLIDECGKRVVLFRNSCRTSNRTKSEAVQVLLDFLRKIQVRYSHEIFENAKAEHDKLIKELQVMEFRKEIRRKLNLLIDSLVVAYKRKREFGDEGAEDIQALIKKDALNLKDEIEKIDQGTNVLEDLKTTVEKILTHLDTTNEYLNELIVVNVNLEKERKRTFFERLADNLRNILTRLFRR